ncbi:MAG: STAS domain-containing protein [Bacteroidales bacterium]|nr:STAS domain-containing protein [Bacteroidales bacterium]
MDFWKADISGLDKKKKKAQILLEGNLTIENVEDISLRILPAINKNKKIILKIDNVENIDISVLQFLYSLYNFQSELNTEISIELKLNTDLTLLMKNAGFENIFKKN